MMPSRPHLSDIATVIQLAVKCVCCHFNPLASQCLTNIQASLYNLGMTGIPITNVNNNCSTGSTALYQANNMVKSGLVRCALALGFERMAPGRCAVCFSPTTVRSPYIGQVWGPISQTDQPPLCYLVQPLRI